MSQYNAQKHVMIRHDCETRDADYGTKPQPISNQTQIQSELPQKIKVTIQKKTIVLISLNWKC